MNATRLACAHFPAQCVVIGPTRGYRYSRVRAAFASLAMFRQIPCMGVRWKTNRRAQDVFEAAAKVGV